MASIISAVLTAGIFIFFHNKFVNLKNEKIKTNSRDFIINILVYLAADCGIAYMFSKSDLNVCSMLSAVFFVNFMYIFSVTDIRYRIIPNIYIVIMIILRTVFILFEGIFSGNIAAVLVPSVIGAGAGLVIMGVASLVSGKKLGGGDIKMFIAAGYFAGAAALMDIILYTTVFCSVVGLILVLLKKCTMKSFIPMAPFAFAGTVAYFILEFAGEML